VRSWLHLDHARLSRKADLVAGVPLPAAPAVINRNRKRIVSLERAHSQGRKGSEYHHAVGRDHRPWYDRQRPELFAAALRAAKRELDPHGMLNPGVLIDL
jgi:FAD/FMN-containing dehydrogenase